MAITFDDILTRIGEKFKKDLSLQVFTKEGEPFYIYKITVKDSPYALDIIPEPVTFQYENLMTSETKDIEPLTFQEFSLISKHQALILLMKYKEQKEKEGKNSYEKSTFQLSLQVEKIISNHNLK